VVPTLLGELFHRAVQRGMYPEAAERDFHRWAGAALRRKGLINETQIQRTIAETVRLLGRLRRWEGFQDLEAADIDRREIPFSYRVGGKLETGRIDVLYRLDGTWTVLEYKTDSIQSQEELQEKIREYQPQVRKYLEAVEGVVGARPSGWIVFLDVEGELQAHRVDEQA
jgi:ATP-dependent exoDNAse (exonuclease V) beta subunit